MDWSDVAEKVKSIAPALAGDLITGDYVGMARTAVAGFMGAEDNSADAVARAIDSNPELAMQLKELDLEKYKAETDRQQMYLDDSASARQMHIAAMENGHGDFQNRLASGVLLGGLFMMAALIFIPESNLSDNLRMFVLGFLTSEMGKVLSHYFGATKWGNRNSTPGAPQARNFMDSIKRK